MGFFVLVMRILCKWKVMIRWLGRWDVVWELAIVQLLVLFVMVAFWHNCTIIYNDI